MKKRILMLLLVTAMLAGCGKTPAAETGEVPDTETETAVLGFTNGVPIGYLREKIGYNQQEMASSLASWTPTITNGLAEIKEAFKALEQ